MKLWPVVAVATVSSALAWACKSEPADADGVGGMGGEGTGGSATGGSATGGSGGEVSCEPDAGSEAWGGAGGAGGAGNVEILGDWTDGYGTYSFDEETIVTGYATYDVVGISDGGQYVVAQNSESDTYYPCLYSRFDWTLDGDDLYLCRTVLDAETVEEAIALPAADREDLEHGCGSSFPWSQLSPQ